MVSGWHLLRRRSSSRDDAAPRTRFPPMAVAILSAEPQRRRSDPMDRGVCEREGVD